MDDFKDRLEAAFVRYPGRRRGLAHRIAEKCGVTDQAVGRWRRTGHVNRENLGPLAEELGVSLEWLLTGRGEITRQEVIDLDVVIIGDTAKGIDPKRIGRKSKAGDQIVHVASTAGPCFALRVMASPELYPRYCEGEVIVVSEDRQLVAGSDVFVQRKGEVSFYRLAWERLGEVALDALVSPQGDGRKVVKVSTLDVCRPVVAIMPPAAIREAQATATT
jgi:transcriptional regulator with XRE-family HTH domain